MKHNTDYIRTEPLDKLFHQIEIDFLQGRVGKHKQTAEYIPMKDIYDQNAYADFHLPIDDKADRKTCPHCQTAYRISEAKEDYRCPFCHHLI